MADNLLYEQPGSGVDVAFEDISSVFYQRCFIGGYVAHDAAAATVRPVGIGGFASAAAPSDVSADGDATQAWCLRNGSFVINLAVGGTLVTGSAGLPVAQQGTWQVEDAGVFAAVDIISGAARVLGTNTYVEGSNVGLIIGAVRRDADTTLVDTTNEFSPLQVDANGYLKVEVFSGETLPVSLTSTTITGTVAVTQSGTWDEIGINDSGNSITVDNGGTFVIQIDGTALTRLTDIETNTDSGAVVGNGAAATAQRVTLANDSTGIVNQGGTWTVQPGNTANTTPWLMAEATRTSGGPTTFHLISAATTNATVVKNAAGQLYGWYIYNNNASMRKVAFHNASSAPTAGASIYFSLSIPAMSGANVFLPHGIPFSTGISITTVTGMADNDANAVGLSDLNINLWYA